MRQSEYLWAKAIGASAMNTARKKHPLRVVIVSAASLAWPSNYSLGVTPAQSKANLCAATHNSRLFPQYRTALRPIGIGVGIIQIVIQPAAFGPRERAFDNQFRHGRNISQLQQIARDDKIPIIFLDFLLQIRDAF